MMVVSTPHVREAYGVRVEVRTCKYEAYRNALEETPLDELDEWDLAVYHYMRQEADAKADDLEDALSPALLRRHKLGMLEEPKYLHNNHFEILRDIFQSVEKGAGFIFVDDIASEILYITNVTLTSKLQSLHDAITIILYDMGGVWCQIACDAHTKGGVCVWNPDRETSLSKCSRRDTKSNPDT